MAQIQPPTHTLDPKLINSYAEVLRLCIETIVWPQMCNWGKGINSPFLGGAWLPAYYYTISVRKATSMALTHVPTQLFLFDL